MSLAGDVGFHIVSHIEHVQRIDYAGEGLNERDMAATPWQQAHSWVDYAGRRARECGDVPEPAALSVATVGTDGQPNVRTVLMRFFTPEGPGFATNTNSAKAGELAANPRIAASLTWPSIFRAIRFRGTARPLPREEVQAYFGTRPWASRISAWASQQSKPVVSREAIEAAYERYAARWPDRGRPDDVPTPDFWGGYRIECDDVEFWAGRRNRLHDRLVFSRIGPGSLDGADAWSLHRLQP